MSNRRNPICPACSKKGITVIMEHTRLEYLWRCKNCNSTYKDDTPRGIQGDPRYFGVGNDFFSSK